MEEIEVFYKPEIEHFLKRINLYSLQRKLLFLLGKCY